MPIALWLGSLLAAATTTATSTPQSPPQRVDLITIGVGAAMYSTFGHSAIRVIRADGSDTAYNFGGVDLKQPNFWIRLTQGKVQAYLLVTTYSDLLLTYSGEDRTIVGRTLALTSTQAQRLVTNLDAIYADPKRRFYDYDHLYNNCSTRVAEILDEAMEGRLKSVASYPVHGTMRDRILRSIRNKPVLYVAMDLAGNYVGDRPITAWETIFMPSAIDRIVDRARVDGRPLAVSKYTDYRSLGFSDDTVWDWPWNKVYFFFVAPLFLLALWWPRITAIVWGGVGGLIGTIYLLFWIGSAYVFYQGNWNIICFPVTHLLLAAALRRTWWERFARPLRYYLLGHAGLCLILLFCWGTGILSQAVYPMLGVALPLSLVLLIRPCSARIGS